MVQQEVMNYCKVPKVAAPVTFRIIRPKGPQLSGGHYFRVAVTFGWLNYAVASPGRKPKLWPRKE